MTTPSSSGNKSTDLLHSNLWCDNNQPEVGCKCGQASQGTVLRHPAMAGRVASKPEDGIFYLFRSTGFKLISQGFSESDKYGFVRYHRFVVCRKAYVKLKGFTLFGHN